MYNSNYKKILSILLVLVLTSLLFTGCTNTSQNLAQNVEQNAQITEGKGIFKNLDDSSIDSENIMNIISELTSATYDGRMAGSEGNDLATVYIADYFNNNGIENPEGLEDYMQFYKQNTLTMNNTPTLHVIDKEGNNIKEYKYLDNFTTNINPSSKIQGEAVAEPVLIENSSELNNKNTSLEGKILLVPYNIVEEAGMPHIITVTLRTSAKGLIVELPSTYIEQYGHPISYVHLGNYSGTNNENGYICNRVSNETFKDLVEQISDDMQIKMTVDYTVEEKEVANVIGYIPGSDEELKNEYIVITAHMDHNGSNKNGTYNPGALDNASGTSVMMELARVISQSDVKPKKSIVFIAFNGEEEGLFGSRYYANNALFPLDKSVVINMDMVGSKEVPLLDIESYDEIKTSLRNEMYDFAQELGITSEKIAGANSDHGSFMFAGIEAITLINPDWKHIHHPVDTIDVINQDTITQVAKLVLYYIDKKGFKY